MNTRAGLLILLVTLGLGASPARADWRDVALPEDQNRIDAGAQRAREALEQLAPTAFGLDERPMLRALLEAPAVAVDEAQLLGDWRCRSLQVSVSLGVFTYPAFRCRIRLDEHGKPFFEKRTGSQRRSGYLYPDEAGRWVFLGGRTVNDEPQRPYSANAPEPDAGARSHDSAGVLEALKDGRLRMILDADGSGVELYELQR